ncbi:MAG: gliding motility-associated C-terminal domain-containing protein [Bacteroidaceae bacterium]|nr:gliding motility-associated C-terminal domain-containing protein [Bacteroidaceae bacterium]
MKQRILYLVLLCAMCVRASAQATLLPSVDPKALYTTIKGDEIEDASESQEAPLIARFTANPSNLGNYTARYEWKIYRRGEEKSPLVHRFEEDLDYTFTESGTFLVQLYATFVLGNDTIAYPEEGEENPFTVSISDSKLTFPNAFSPNKTPDGFNDELKAKEYQSIVEFKAAVFNRWGQKIYTWDKVEGGWDGKWNGRLVKDGVYFLVVTARGADGKKYNIRKAITVLTGYNDDSKGGSTDD